jgi:agmatinase
VATILGAGAMPLVLGGDHSVTEPAVRACAALHGPVALVHFDAHTDTARECFGVRLSHGTPMYRLVEGGFVDPIRYVQIGLRGYWPGQEVFAWQAERGITSFFMHDILDCGLAGVLGETLELIGQHPAYLTVDVDVLDPAFAPGTGTPEPGGLSSRELLVACRRLSCELRLVGADVVEVAPTAFGTADITALVGARIAHEILTGVAVATLQRDERPAARS